MFLPLQIQFMQNPQSSETKVQKSIKKFSKQQRINKKQLTRTGYSLFYRNLCVITANCRHILHYFRYLHLQDVGIALHNQSSHKVNKKNKMKQL